MRIVKNSRAMVFDELPAKEVEPMGGNIVFYELCFDAGKKKSKLCGWGNIINH